MMIYLYVLCDKQGELPSPLSSQGELWVPILYFLHTVLHISIFNLYSKLQNTWQRSIYEYITGVWSNMDLSLFEVTTWINWRVGISVVMAFLLMCYLINQSPVEVKFPSADHVMFYLCQFKLYMHIGKIK